MLVPTFVGVYLQIPDGITIVAVACRVRLSCSVFYGVQCVIVRVTCGAHSHIALRLQCAYVWREACI